MGWPLVAAIGLSVGASVYGGQASARTTRANAQSAYQANAMSAMAAQQAANMNAAMTMAVGGMQASMIGQVGARNAALQMASAKANVEQIRSVTQYNSLLQQQATEYNNSMLETELPMLMDAYGLQSEQLRQAAARQEGAIVAHQAASGIVVGQDSPAEVVIDHRSQVALEQFILRHNLDIAIDDVHNAIARNTWEGEAAIAKLNFEANAGILNTLKQGKLSALTTLGQAQLDVAGTLFNSTANAFSLRSAGQAQYITGMSQANAAWASGQNTANQQLTAGWLNGIGNAAMIFAGSYGVPSGTGSTRTLPSPSVAPYSVNRQIRYPQPSVNSPGSSLLA